MGEWIDREWLCCIDAGIQRATKTCWVSNACIVFDSKPRNFAIKYKPM